jgi:hypothetical protein
MLKYPDSTFGTITGGSTGPTGCSFLSGTGIPTGPCYGCDTYIDLLTGLAYVCMSGAWTGPAGNTFRGPTGPTGVTGASFFGGTGNPFGPCNEGDTYVNYRTGEIFICGPGGWDTTDKSIKGPTGPTGLTGTSFFSGTGIPTDPCIDGDTYVDLETGDVWKCVVTEWVQTVNNIRGPTGPTGTSSDWSDGSLAYGTMWIVGHQPFPSNRSPNPQFKCTEFPTFTSSVQTEFTPTAYWFPGTGPYGAPLKGMYVNFQEEGMIIQETGIYALMLSFSAETRDLTTSVTDIFFQYFANKTQPIGLWTSLGRRQGDEGVDKSASNIQIAAVSSGTLVELWFSSDPGDVLIHIDNILVTIVRIA